MTKHINKYTKLMTWKSVGVGFLGLLFLRIMWDIVGTYLENYPLDEKWQMWIMVGLALLLIFGKDPFKSLSK